MAEEKSTADGFPDKGSFILPHNKRKKPDCDRKTLIPDPCDLRIDRRKKTLENNDCEITPAVQVCPEDLAKFTIPELPPSPALFEPVFEEPRIIEPAEAKPAPNFFCNDEFVLECPSPGWIDPEWVLTNFPKSGIIIDEDGYLDFSNSNINNAAELDLDEFDLDEDIYIEPDDSGQYSGGDIIVTECAFSASTKQEANWKARQYAASIISCKFANKEIEVDCEQFQSMALHIGGEGYTSANTSIELIGDGEGAEVLPIIGEGGRIERIEIVKPGADYEVIDMTVQGDGVGGAVGAVEIDDETGELLNVSLGQVFPDPNYDANVDPEIYSNNSPVKVPKETYVSSESQEDADTQAFNAGIQALDCMYQNPEIHKPCPTGTVPKEGIDFPKGGFKTLITSGTQSQVNANAASIVDALDCIEICCPDGFPDMNVSINVWDPNQDCDGDGEKGSVGNFDAGFDCESCEFYLKGDIPLPEIPCECGFETSVKVTGLEFLGEECDAEGSAYDEESMGTVDPWDRSKRYREGELVYDYYKEELDVGATEDSERRWVGGAVGEPSKFYRVFRAKDGFSTDVIDPFRGVKPGYSPVQNRQYWDLLSKLGLPVINYTGTEQEEEAARGD